MKWKVLIPIILIILVLAAGYFFRGYLGQRLEGEIAAFLEEEYSLEIEFTDIQYWPLNQLFIDGLTVEYRGEKIFESKKVKFYYDTIELLGSIRDLKVESYLQGLSYLELQKPRLKMDSELLQQLIEDSDSEAFYLHMSGVKFYMNDGQALLNKKDDELSLREIEGEIIFNSKGFDLEARSDLKTTGTDYDSRQIPDSQFEDLQLSLSMGKGDRWQARLDSDWFTLSPFLNILEKEDISKELDMFNELDINEIEGEGRLTLNIEGISQQISEYKALLELREGKIKADYAKKNEEINLANIEGKTEIDSEQKRLKTQDLRFEYEKNPYNFAGFIDFAGEERDIYGRLQSRDFNIENFTKYLDQPAEIDFIEEGQIDLVLNGTVESPVLSLDLYLPRAGIAGEDMNNFQLKARYEREAFYLDSMKFQMKGDNSLKVEGIYDLSRDNYNFHLQGKRLSSDLISGYMEEFSDYDRDFTRILKNEKGKLSFDVSLSGHKRKLSNMSLIGEFDYNSSHLDNLEGDLWLAEEKLIIEEGIIESAGNSMNINGEINIANGELDLNGGGKELSIASLQGRFEDILPRDIPEAAGKTGLDVKINGHINNPRVNGEVNIDDVEIAGYYFDKFEAGFGYTDRQVQFSELVLNHSDASVMGKGLVDLTGDYPSLNAEFNTDGIASREIEELFDFKMPVTGSIKGILSAGGHLFRPDLEGHFTSEDMKLQTEDVNYDMEEVEVSFNRPHDQSLEVDELIVKGRNKARLEAGGTVDRDSFDLEYRAKGFALSDFDMGKELEADVSSRGEVKGSLSNPQVFADIELAEVYYQNRNLENFAGNLSYKDDKLSLDNFQWLSKAGTYDLEGEIVRVLQKPELDIKLKTDDGDLQQLLSLGGVDLPSALDYHLQGEILINGDLENPEAEIDMFAHNRSGMEIVYVTGWMDDDLHIDFAGEDIKISELASELDTGVELTGKMDFQGEINGPVDDFDLEVSTNVREAAAGGFPLKEVKGDIFYHRGEEFQLEQSIIPEGGGELRAKGSIYPLRESLDVEINSDNLPLQLLQNTVNIVNRAEGTIEGRTRLQGDITQPELSGQMDLNGEILDTGLPHKFKDFSGKINYSGSKIDVSGIEGRYGDGDFNITGNIHPFAEENWDLVLSGKDLSFSRGSYEGLFDTEGVKMTGSWLQPYFKGDLTPHDFLVTMPFEWPTEDGETAFSPEMELTLHPGDEVYFRRQQNIDVLIEEGYLTLIFEDEDFRMEGELYSQQGNFDFYNNKFILQEASADFSRFEEYIPTLHVRATTVIDGVEVTVRLDGPADDMATTLTSRPQLSEREIMALLTQKGGLGEMFREDEDLSRSELVGRMAQKEIVRLLQSTFQADFISELEERLQRFFFLDHIEINTYELGWRDELIVTLGKNLNDKLYLEYVGTVGTDEVENEVTFSYSLTERTRLEGSWLGDDEYRLSVDTTLDF